MSEVLVLRPKSGAFDVDTVSEYLCSLPNASLDPVDGVYYMVAGDPQSLQRALHERISQKPRFPYSAVLIGVTTTAIRISWRTTRTESARAFVDWLGRKYVVRVFDEAENEITQPEGGLGRMFDGPVEE